jgi:MarR family transcriptional regulator, lower aerobic nicotinate degradation pathway regulator
MDPSEYIPPRRLEQLASWLAGQLARNATRIVDEALAEDGARRQHFTVLTALAEQGPMSQAELGRRLWIDRSDLHSILNELQDDGLVARAPDAEDRRRNRVHITAAGDAVRERLDARVQDAQDTLLAPLSRADRRELHRLLEQLVKYHRNG